MTAAPLLAERRLIGTKEAAQYCGVSAGTLEKCPVKPVRIGSRKMWDRRALDAWIDAANNLTPTTEPLVKKLRRIRG